MAYRALAGRLHPDRMVDGSPAERALAERRMREVNEAWQALQDPARRRRYDDGLVGRDRRATTAGTGGRGGAGAARSTTPVPTADEDDDLVDVLPPMGAVAAGLFRHGPWVALVLVLGLIFVATAYAGDDDPVVEGPAPVRAGACVDVATGPTTTVVPCDGPHDLRIVRRVREGQPCPAGTERRRLGTDGLLDCVNTA